MVEAMLNVVDVGSRLPTVGLDTLNRVLGLILEHWTLLDITITFAKALSMCLSKLWSLFGVP